MRSLFAFAAAMSLVSMGCSGGVETEPTTNTGDVTITEVIPAEGPLTGNVPVQIKGTGFTEENLLVTFGGSSVGDAEVLNSTTIRGTLPPHSQPGVVDVVVACAAGQFTLQDGFEYSEASAISITGITPNNGPLTGGTTVTITGTGFSSGATTVTFGTNNGTGVSVVSDAQLTVLTPAAAANGPVAVAVTNDNGTTQLPNAFVYGNGGPGPGPGGETVAENLGGIAEFNRVLTGSDPATSAGQAFFFAPSDVLYPANNTCALNLDQFPSVTSTLDAGAQVTLQQATTSLSLPKDTSTPNFPIYLQQNGAGSAFTLGQMAGLMAPGAGGVPAFNLATIASAPSADYDARLNFLYSFSGGLGFWSGASDLWVDWDPGTTTDHIQVFLVGGDLAGATHVLQCDIRNGDTGAFCIKGGGSGDLCATPGATMTDFWTALGGPVVGFGGADVYLYRGNRSTFSLPGGGTGALDVNVVRTTSIVMSE